MASLGRKGRQSRVVARLAAQVGANFILAFGTALAGGPAASERYFLPVDPRLETLWLRFLLDENLCAR